MTEHRIRMVAGEHARPRLSYVEISQYHHSYSGHHLIRLWYRYGGWTVETSFYTSCLNMESIFGRIDGMLQRGRGTIPSDLDGMYSLRCMFADCMMLRRHGGYH